MLAHCWAVSHNAVWNAESGESWQHVLHRNIDASTERGILGSGLFRKIWHFFKKIRCEILHFPSEICCALLAVYTVQLLCQASVIRMWKHICLPGAIISLAVFCVVALYKSAFTYLYYLCAVLLYRLSTSPGNTENLLIFNSSWKHWKSPGI